MQSNKQRWVKTVTLVFLPTAKKPTGKKIYLDAPGMDEVRLELQWLVNQGELPKKAIFFTRRIG
jgi:hypothetical protein